MRGENEDETEAAEKAEEEQNAEEFESEGKANEEPRPRLIKCSSAESKKDEEEEGEEEGEEGEEVDKGKNASGELRETAEPSCEFVKKS